MTKSDSIEEGKETIDELSASIAAKTAEKEEMEAAVQKKKKELEEHEAKLAETKALLEKKAAEYEAAAADLSKAISSLEGAIKTLEASKPTAFLQEPELVSDLQRHIAQAQALNLITEQHEKAVATFLQAPVAFLQGESTVDPSDPSYKFKSQGIIDVLEKLLKEYLEKKAALDAEWEETKQNLTDLIAQLSEQIEAAKNFIAMGEEKIEQLSGEIAAAREKLVDTEATLKDDELYMTDLTKQCEERAVEYDQRSAARGDELSALGQALDIIENKVKGVEGDRALLQKSNDQNVNGTKADEMAKVLRQAQDTDYSPALLQVG